MANHEQPKASGAERGLRFLRNINALGALAIGGLAAIIPGPNAILAGWAGLNAAQAGGLEVWRRHVSKNRSKPKG